MADSRYIWQSDDESGFAHACLRVSWMGGGNWRAMCRVSLGGSGNYPDMRKAIGKPKCGLCLDELKVKYGASEAPGEITVERQQEEVENHGAGS